MINRYLRAYYSQKSGATRRGIEFNLNFKQWCDFWGEDIERRGNGPNDLQMQRIADTGPYEVGNIRKGTPKQNAKTAGHMKRLRASVKAHQEMQMALDRAMYENHEPELPQFDEFGWERESRRLGIKSSYSQRYYHRD